MRNPPEAQCSVSQQPSSASFQMKIGSSSWNHLDRVDGTQTWSEQAVSQRFAKCLDVIFREFMESRPVKRVRRVHSVPAGGGGDKVSIMPLGEEPEQFRFGCR